MNVGYEASFTNITDLKTVLQQVTWPVKIILNVINCKNKKVQSLFTIKLRGFKHQSSSK